MEKNIIINGHEAVDLGLSVKWATCNIGASKPEELGDMIYPAQIFMMSSDKNWSVTNGLKMLSLATNISID